MKSLRLIIHHNFLNAKLKKTEILQFLIETSLVMLHDNDDHKCHERLRENLNDDKKVFFSAMSSEIELKTLPLQD